MSEWKLVPVKPTIEMIENAYTVSEVDDGRVGIYDAFLAAAPEVAVADRIEELERENAALRAKYQALALEHDPSLLSNEERAEWAAHQVPAADRTTELERENAERYRWLLSKMVRLPTGWTLNAIMPGDDPEAAIDTARAKEPALPDPQPAIGVDANGQTDPEDEARYSEWLARQKGGGA